MKSVPCPAVGEGPVVIMGPEKRRHAPPNRGQGMTPMARAAAFAATLIVACLPAYASLAPSFEYTVQATNLSFEGGEWVAIADVNNDGRDDLLNIVDVSGSSLAIRLQRVDGKLDLPISLTMPMGHILSVEGVDLDGNGSVEVVAGYDRGVILYRWNGEEFVPSVYNVGLDCLHIATADLDRNGTPDILCQSTKQQAFILPIDASGLPGEATYFPMTAVRGWSTRQIKLADVTGDGYPDLLAVDAGVWAFFVYENDRTGGFLPARAYGIPREFAGSTSSAIEAIDADGDGVDEVAVGIGGGSMSRVLLYRRDAYGALRPWRQFPSKSGPSTFLKHDVDGDGRLDLLVGHMATSAIGRYMNSASGLSSMEIVSGNIRVGGLYAFMAVGDLNGDGRTDVAVNNSSYEVSLKYGMRRPRRDVSGDLQTDILWRYPATGQNILWINAQSTSAVTLPSVAAPWVVAALADFDNDGKADVFWRNPATGANMIWRAGNSATLQPTVPAATPWKIVGTGDFDGDGSADVLWRNGNSGGNVIWLGARSDRTRVVSSELLARQVVGVGDFDGDGSADVLWRNTETGENAIWFSADSTTAVSIAAMPVRGWTVGGVGDFNGDTMDDIMWHNIITGENTIWLSADATKQQSTMALGRDWIVAAIGDYSGDGKDDILWRNRATGWNSIMRDGNQSAYDIAIAGAAWQVVP
ncbi:VCBS repeat-containing protein [Lysobacter sp. KIS68-7]|uniref:FG-GAP repeat domain-containing protein n=1 Tax=Lysobacter sp. KIS68-7 TaxID=2904252 RepID=UPI001E333F50|nr:VCBS repeat-containing protein [Lysobacter sp. KIS68-7]UHQ18688.1 VCBS repeat-containing protein [Lysobacter sp. KIS68-7]